MNNINYQTMSKQELKKYFLEHREDKKAFQEYLDRRHQNSKPTTTADDPLFDSKIQEAIRQQINQNQRQS
ncbi:UNVERIFIED_CONTAM: hypothetical protein BEN50_01665 [Euhalothece sp. KZN 001]|uniref:Uncharacterized protein n=1 Tax=Dactylococcopsis salina (strain PCC 8305) TaxID=13035 RepID=K9YS07_DACS8|nr:hypothetical protein Dacsa_0357 [Dactylococcopsis salina PCC 8305]